VWKVFVFLPPKHHLLMVFQVAASQTVVRFNSDYWLSLAYIDQFFDRLLAEQHVDAASSGSSSDKQASVQ
jgi:AP-5 complex subunit beta-1